MKVTRDVIYDLLPAYFAGEASAETQALIEEFFTTDPEFGRMAARFRQIHEEMHADHDGATTAFGDVEHFRAARARAENVHTANGLALGFTLGAVMAIVIGLFRGSGDGRNPGFVIAAVFLAVAAFSWASGRMAAHTTPIGLGAALKGRRVRRRHL